MEAWSDLATALDESSVLLGRTRCVSNIIINQNFATPASKQIKNKGFCRRRTKSTGNIIDKAGQHSSSNSEGEMEDFQEQAQSSVQQTETDEGSIKDKMTIAALPSGLPFAIPCLQNALFGTPASPSRSIVVKTVGQPLSVAESDSLNETASPMRPHTRRKRRFKRMAVDPEPVVQAGLELDEANSQQNLCLAGQQKSFSFSTFASSSIFAKPRQRKVKKKPVNVQKIPNIVIGKRKRNVRERSIECELEKISLNSSPETGAASNLSAACCSDASLIVGHLNNDSMDLDMKQLEQVSSSSVSGSESDPGFYTYDDGREADDEQSDWYQENGPTWGVPGNPWWERDGPQRQFRFRAAGAVGGTVEELEADDTDQDDAAGEEKKFQQLLKGSWQHLSDEAKDAYRLRMQKLRDRIPGREIRAGRRHLGAQRGPSFSILTSANEKLSRFLQDPAQSELRLHPMQKSERDQLSRLASLYSLQMLSEGARGLKCPVLKKTSNTMQAVRIDMDRSPSLWSDYKRQRKTPPASVTSENEAPPIDEKNIGSQILKCMGWTPGSGLGPQGAGRTSPVGAVVRPKYLGLGHGSKSNDVTAEESSSVETASVAMLM
ncbi:G patch domain-containing protein 2-like isoform X2 [Daphnia pulex]|uniref:G patch domain-containing protein 2-like isoform X2 n=1 Tax=Daphnia pulex TaxID=6669 RepID=UPI001EE0124B|nr:G patch domain-containing protein 2-like isoform X2 [Daphnia pulex]